ncbi:MAG: polysaccharide biosynthesis/export family protein [Candidatus Sulfotelmatobacter sp.]
MFSQLKNRIAAILLVSLASALCSAQQVVSENVPAKTATDTAPQLQTRDTRYKIAPGDSFDLNFELSPEFNQTAVAVQPDGFVTLRGVGDLNVQGQTVPELTQTLRGAYNKILNDPIISVVLKDFEKPYFVADGQIGKPGKYDLRGDTTLTQAIAIAGGFKDSSRHSQVLLFRRVSDQWMEAKVINVKQMEKSGNLKEDPMLHPGDMLFVPKNTMSKIDKFFPSASMGTFFRPY